MKGGAAFLLPGLLAAQDPGQLRIEREVFLRTGSSHRLAWSPDGSQVASGGDRGEVLVVEAVTGKVAHELEASDHWIRGLAFAPDGRALAVVGRDLTVWDLPGGSLRGRHPTSPATAVAWTSDGSRLGCILDSDAAALLDARDLTVVRRLALGDDTAADAIAFAPDGKRVAVGKRSGVTYVFATGTGQLQEKIAQDGQVQDLAWLEDGRLLRLSWNGILHGFTAAPLAVGKGAWGMAADPRGRACLVWNGDHIRGFSAGEPFTVAGHGVAATSPDGNWVRAQDHRLEFFTRTELQRTLPLPHRAWPRNMELLGNGRYLAVGDGASPIHVFTTAEGTRVDLRGADLRGTLLPYRAGNELVTWQPPSMPLPDEPPGLLSWWSIDALRDGLPGLVRKREIACRKGSLDQTGPRLCPDGRFFAVTNRVCDLMQPGDGWSVAGGYGQSLVPAAGGGRALLLTSRPKRHGGGTGTLELYGSDGNRQQHLEVDEVPWNVSWSPDGQTIGLLTGSGLRLLDPGTLAERRRFRGSWRELAWVDAGRLLLLEHESAIVLLGIAAPERSTRLELRSKATELSLDHRGERAAVALDDRVLLLRVAK